MLQPGDLVPQFEVRTVNDEPFSYSTIWQRRNLVLVTLPRLECDACEGYIARLTRQSAAFSGQNAECLITRDDIPGVPSPSTLVADKWGEIVHLTAASEVSDLPSVDELLDWVGYVQSRCPECEGEAR